MGQTARNFNQFFSNTCGHIPGKTGKEIHDPHLQELPLGNLSNHLGHSLMVLPPNGKVEVKGGSVFNRVEFGQEIADSGRPVHIPTIKSPQRFEKFSPPPPLHLLNLPMDSMKTSPVGVLITEIFQVGQSCLKGFQFKLFSRLQQGLGTIKFFHAELPPLPGVPQATPPLPHPPEKGTRHPLQKGAHSIETWAFSPDGGGTGQQEHH